MTMPNSGQAQTTRRHRESGYSLLMVVFMVATSLILSAAVVPNLLTQGRREREEEMVWRGEQYERAIGLYFKKFGRYPTKIDDLTKQTNGARFLRQAYTDPMNKEDGSWRFIYVGPNGQLIGSVHSTSLLQSMLTAPTLPGASALGAGPQPPPPTGTTPGIGATGVGQTGQQTGQQPGQQTSGTLAPNPLQSQPQPLQGQVIGGNIIGVGSKIKKPSLRVYDRGTNYGEWEFVWNPMQQVTIPGQGAPVNPNAPPTQQQQQQQPNQQTPPGNSNVPLSTQPVL
jgi:type II secretory pathway pseudopilin PulG